MASRKPPRPEPSDAVSGSELVRFGVAVERPLLEAFDEHLSRRGYENRSEALRDLVRAELARDAWDRGEPAIATISLIYDHHVRELTERLVEIQHEHGDRVISTTHVHLDHHHCLEVVLAKGPANQLKRLADRLIGAKGVISGEVSGMSIVGRSQAAHGGKGRPAREGAAARPGGRTTPGAHARRGRRP
jgi:CopG family nickel-responsive transcriptional regulator